MICRLLDNIPLNKLMIYKLEVDKNEIHLINLILQQKLIQLT